MSSRSSTDGTPTAPTSSSPATREQPLWLLSGRQLGLLLALLVQVEAGICVEAVITGRAIHDASRLLHAFCVSDADDLVRVWLDDQGRHDYVKQRPARDAEERYESALAEAMEAAGLPRIASSAGAIVTLYDVMSRVAHNRRSSCLDSASEVTRVFAYGPHPSAIERARYAGWAASMTTEVANSVGDALRALYSQPKFISERIVLLRRGIEAVGEFAPLDERSIRCAAGTA